MLATLMPHELRYTAEEIDEALRQRTHGQLELALLDLHAHLATVSRGKALLLVEYPGPHRGGGLRLQARRANWFTRLAWRCARSLPLWEE